MPKRPTAGKVKQGITFFLAGIMGDTLKVTNHINKKPRNCKNGRLQFQTDRMGTSTGVNR